MQELTFWDYVTLGVSAVVLLVWAVLRVQRALNPHVGRGAACSKGDCASVNIADIGSVRSPNEKK
jgi:hypothetical protein